LLKKNGKTRAIVLWAHGLLDGVPDETIEEAKKLAMNESHKQARALWENNISASKYDGYYFNRFMNLVRSDYVRESKTRLEDALRTLMLKEGVMGAEDAKVNTIFCGII